MISTFLWRRWQNIQNEVRQNLRSSAIFTVTATRALLTAFDIDNKDNKHRHLGLNMTNYCHYKTNWFWNPNAGFRSNWTWGWEDAGIGFWLTAFQCMVLLFLVTR